MKLRKKAAKKNSSTSKGSKSNSKKLDNGETSPKYNAYVYFNREEICEIKGILRIKDTLNIPVVIGSTILNKFQILQKLLKDGLNVNEIGPNNTTPLIWAIKYKYLDLVHFLLKNGADPNIQCENGEHVLFIALEHKLWEEESFVNLWNSVNETPNGVDVNLTNKTGHTLVHIGVRREWMTFVNILLKLKANVNIANDNNVTPLMTACVKNNMDIIEALLKHGADVKYEDHYYRTSLCYAINNAIKQNSMLKCPIVLVDKLIGNDVMAKDSNYNDCAQAVLKDYIKRKLCVLNIALAKDDIPEAIIESIQSMIIYVTHYTIVGVRFALELRIFDHLTKLLKKYLENTSKTTFILNILKELMLYNEQSVSFQPELQSKMMDQFFASGMSKFCIDLIKSGRGHPNRCCTVSMHLLLIYATCNETGYNWLKENCEEMRTVFEHVSEEDLNRFQDDVKVDNRLKSLRKRLKKLKRILNSLPVDMLIAMNDDLTNTVDGNDSTKRSTASSKCSVRNDLIMVSSKKSKRRSRAIKAKASIKSAGFITHLESNSCLEGNLKCGVNQSDAESVLTMDIGEESTSGLKISNCEEHDNITGNDEVITIKDLDEAREDVNCQNDNMDSKLNNMIDVEFEKTNPVTTSLLNYLKNEIDKNLLPNIDSNNNNYGLMNSNCAIPASVDWKSKVFNLPFNNWPQFGDANLKIDRDQLIREMDFLKTLANDLKENRKVNDSINIGSESRIDNAISVVVHYLKELLDIIINRCKNERELDGQLLWNEGSRITMYEKMILVQLEENFNQLIVSIQNLAHKNISEALENIFKVESSLLLFEIHGKRLLSDICAMESVRVKYVHFPYFMPNDNYSSLTHYVEDVLNGFNNEVQENGGRIKIVECRYNKRNTNPVVKMRKEADGMRFANEFELISSNRIKFRANINEAQQRTLEHSYHLIESVESILQSDDDNYSYDDDLSDGMQHERNTFASNTIKSNNTCVTNNVFKPNTNSKELGGEKRTVNSRWISRIAVLETAKDYQLCLDGDVKLGTLSDKSYIISQGGNFNPVIFGLDPDSKPLAVKRIPREHYVCKMLKNLITPLMDLHNKNVLQYFACDYDSGSYMILATPLCEYNIGQYVLLLKEKRANSPFNLTSMDIIFQFLNGIAYLHEQQPDGVVHGNLKPSNIFIDVNGKVRVAEFGISKALYKLTEAPKTSLIWFAQETYQVYKNSSVMECTARSDIQVAGMLVYFILSGGIHPLGAHVDEILKNLDRNTFTLTQIREGKNKIFSDLVMWMLMCEPADRPTIRQILSHVLFWSNDRRWRLILNCAGINECGECVLVNLCELHEAIHRMSTQEQIKGHWMNIVKKKFPQIRFQGNDDTAIGLLKFIRYFYDDKSVTDENVSELQQCILAYFPALPLTLYRILEATRWINHPVFSGYTRPESTLPFL